MSINPSADGLRPMRPIQRQPLVEEILPLAGDKAPAPPAPSGRQSCAFQCAMKFLGPWEGGYSNNPNDSGGATMRGITHSQYDSYRTEKGLPLQDVSKLSDEEHDDIYYNRYWVPSGADKLPPNLAVSQFDWAVNHGPAGATKTLQESLGFTGTDVDGKWGPGTQAALDGKIAEPNGQQSLLDTYLNNRAQWYTDRAAAAPSQAGFLKGWLARVDSPPDATGRQGIRTYLADMNNQCPGCGDSPSPGASPAPAPIKEDEVPLSPVA